MHVTTDRSSYDACQRGARQNRRDAVRAPRARAARLAGALRLMLAGALMWCVWALPGVAKAAADQDGDQVPDSADCAPSDLTLARLHRFYRDADGDQFGDAAQSVDQCALVPPPGLVVWGNDPNDADSSVVPVPVARGSRVLGLGFPETATQRQALAPLTHLLGAKALSVELEWDRLESSPGIFNGPDFDKLAAALAAASRDGVALDLTVSAVSGVNITMPADLATGIYAGSYGFDAASVTGRYAALLDEIHARTGSVPLVSLQVAYEFDELMALQPSAPIWQGLQRFITAAATAAKQRWGAALPVGATATFAGLVDAVSGPLLQSLNAQTDVVGVTYRPRDASFQAPEPSVTVGDLEGLATRYAGRQLHFTSVAYPSLPANGSSTTQQSQFLMALFDFWDAHAATVGYFGFEQLFDASSASAASEAARPVHRATATTFAAAVTYFSSLGLRPDAALASDKPAFQTLRTLAYARGWDTFIHPQSRPYHLALTSFPYAQTPGESLDAAVLDTTYRAIAANSDLVVHHFDKGVPWTEALNDTLRGAPPYSANVREVWQQHAERLPPGMAVAVAVNALGIPRDRLAPYWGVGEGLYLDANFRPAGTGIVDDYVDRMLPPPFDTARLDSPQVRTAYLNYIKRVIDQFHPAYIITGLEVNLSLESQQADTFAQYLELQKFIYASLKADPTYASVKVVVSFTSEQFMSDEFGSPLLIDALLHPSLMQSHFDALDALLPYTDVVGLSIYPIKTRYLANSIPAYLFEKLFSALRQHTAKPFAITETGYPSSSFDVGAQHFRSDPDKQARYMELLLTEAARLGNVEFVTNFSSHDLTPHLDVLRQLAAQSPPQENSAIVDFFKYFEFNGLYTAANVAKPAEVFVQRSRGLPYTGPSNQLPAPVTIGSPDRQLEVTIDVDTTGALRFGVKRNGQVVLEPSRLGVRVDGVDLGAGATALALTAPLEVNEPYDTTGAHTRADNHYLLSTLTVTRANQRDALFNIEWRIFNDGVAYRYVIPGQQSRTITGEASSWVLPAGARVWYQNNTANYENQYFNNLIGEFSDDVGPPATAKLPNQAGYVTLSEAASENYSGMTLRASLGVRNLRTTFLDDLAWQVAGGSNSPWRVAIIAPDLNTLVNSDVIGNLNPPIDNVLFPDGKRPTWVRPGKALWSWWSNQDSGFSYDIQQHYVDEAHSLGMDFVLVDVWWERGFPSGGTDQFQRLKQLVDYAHVDGRNVDIWVWKNWFELLEPADRESFFTKVKAAGAVGVKVDNVQGEGADSAISNVVRELLTADAARHQLMLNFHGMSKPVGTRRTYPHMVGQEAVGGLEVNGLAWASGWFLAPWHNAALPFTRMVVGPADYTPVTFDLRKLGATTIAHQLATAGLFHSSVLHFADSPEVLRTQPLALDVLRELPTEWDETVVLPGSEIGERVVMARRKGDIWYLFAINGSTDQAALIKPVDLSFLGAGTYTANLIGDKDRSSLSRADIASFSRTTPLEIGMLPGGGFVGVFKPDPVTRSFRMGSVSIPPSLSRWPDLYAHLATNADLVIHTFQEGVPWVEALHSSSVADYGPHLQNRLWELKFLTESATPHHETYLMVNPIDVSYEQKAPYWGQTNYMKLPPPWDTLPFDHPDVKQAYVNYLIALIEFLHPTYLAINVEANIYLAKRPQDWAAFKNFNAFVYARIKQLYPKLVVFSTIQYEHMLGLHTASAQLQEQVRNIYPTALTDEVKALFRDSDVIGISTYPYMVANNPGIVGGGTLVKPDYFDPILAIADELKLPIAFEQTGYTSEPIQISPSSVIQGDEASQQKFIRFLLALSAQHHAVLFGHFVAIDYGNAYGTDPVALTWSKAGLYRQDGSAKPVFQDWLRYFQMPYTPTAR